MVLHLVESSILSPTEWPSCDLTNKNKKRPFNIDATLVIQPEKKIDHIFIYTLNLVIRDSKQIHCLLPFYSAAL